MRHIKSIGVAAAMAAMITAVPNPAAFNAQAMPNVASKSEIAPYVSDKVIKVRGWRHKWGEQDRRKYWRRHHRHYDHHFNPGAFITLGIIGALINNGLSEHEARSAMQRCDDRFRSFEWDTGLYTTYGGEKRLCPYLR